MGINWSILGKDYIAVFSLSLNFFSCWHILALAMTCCFYDAFFEAGNLMHVLLKEFTFVNMKMWPSVTDIDGIILI